MILLNPILLGGLVAALIPIAVHVIHRRQLTRVHWGAMRFIQDMLVQSRRKLLIDQWLLLAVRMLLIVLVVVALTRPACQINDEGAVQRVGKTSAVILIDNSVSSRSGRGESRLQIMRALAQAYVQTLSQGDEVSLILMDNHDVDADPVYDLSLIEKRIASMESSDVHSDITRLLEAGIEQLERHLNPNVEVVIVSDGMADGWQSTAAQKWSVLRSRLQSQSQSGVQRSPRVIVLSPPMAQEQSNLAVADLRTDRSVVGPERTVAITARVVHHGGNRPLRAVLRLVIDGRTLEETPIDLAPDVSQEVVFSHRFTELGSHAITAELVGARDALASDDVRSVALEVVNHIPVLMVEGRRGGGLTGSGALVVAALNPDAQVQPSDLFKVERIGALDLPHVRLADYKVAILADVQALTVDGVAALERFVADGGGLIVGFGPGTDIDHVNRLWARDGDGFLACPLGGQVVTQALTTPRISDSSSSILSAFQSVGQEAWASTPIREYIQLRDQELPSGEVSVPLRLDNGDPLLALRQRGQGTVAVLATSLDMTWSDLPMAAGFVPLMRSLVTELVGSTTGLRNLHPADSLIVLQSTAAEEAQLVGPDGLVIQLEQSTWEGRPARLSHGPHAAGLYRLRLGDRFAHYAVNVSEIESQLDPVDVDQLRDLLGSLPLTHLGSVDAVVAAFGDHKGADREWWRWVLVGALLLALFEVWLARRQSVEVRGP